MKILIGYTGFVGSNLARLTPFDRMYNSKNISEAYDTNPDLMIYAGVPAAKYLANKAPEEDLAVIRQAEENIARIAPKKLVLISTIDIFPVPMKVDENTIPDENNEAYGRNRRELELWTQEYHSDSLIIRLPALFGANIKKNFIYDILHPVPFRLTDTMFVEFSRRESKLEKYYETLDNGFFQLKQMHNDEEIALQKIFNRLGFSALNFTDSRSLYQFYPLSRLWQDIEIALENNLQLFHPATEPITAGELYEKLTGQKFINELEKAPAKYDYRTCYGTLFGGRNEYIMSKQIVIDEINKFVKGMKKLKTL